MNGVTVGWSAALAWTVVVAEVEKSSRAESAKSAAVLLKRAYAELADDAAHVLKAARESTGPAEFFDEMHNRYPLDAPALNLAVLMAMDQTSRYSAIESLYPLPYNGHFGEVHPGFDCKDEWVKEDEHMIGPYLSDCMTAVLSALQSSHTIGNLGPATTARANDAAAWIAAIDRAAVSLSAARKAQGPITRHDVCRAKSPQSGCCAAHDSDTALLAAASELCRAYFSECFEFNFHELQMSAAQWALVVEDPKNIAKYPMAVGALDLPDVDCLMTLDESAMDDLSEAVEEQDVEWAKQWCDDNDLLVPHISVLNKIAICSADVAARCYSTL